MLFLTDAELYELTGKRLPSAQCRALTLMGIRFVQRPDGKPKIPRAWIEGAQQQAPRRPVLALEAIK